jgi:mannose-6-phosphate isomerase
MSIDTVFRLLPTLSERPWGVTSLAPWIDAQVPECIGEAWFSATGNQTSLGATLGSVIAADPAGVLGTGAFPGSEPLLVKLLFTSARLSVQVHPDDEYARAHHGSAGKTEAWHVLRAGPGAELGLGFTRRLVVDEAREAARNGEIEHLVAWRPVSAGETFLVPAGTVHAIGPDLTILEVQEPSDVTYRLYDYGRPRELHLDHGFTVADLGPYRADRRGETLSPSREILARCAFFTIERVRVQGQAAFAKPAPTYLIVVVTEGTGTIAGLPFAPGAVFLVPASCRSFHVAASADATMMVAYTADDLAGVFSCEGPVA